MDNQNSKGKHIRIALSVLIVAVVAIALFAVYYPFFMKTDKSVAGFANNIIYIAIAFFLVVFGIVFTLISCACLLFDKKAVRLVLAGLLSMTVGLWTLSCTGMTQLISYDARYNTILGFEAEYAVPLLLMLFMLTLVGGKYRKMCYIPAVLAIMFVVFVNIAFFATDSGSEAFHGVSMVVNAAESAFTLYILARLMRDKKPIVLTDRVMLAGVSCYACTLILYSVVYFVSEYLFGIHIVQAYRLISIGALIFVAGLIVNYQLFILDSRQKAREKKELLSIAYVDTLTQISNRTKIEHDIKNLAHEKDYAIISFDLNDLKDVNDQYGHNMGDKLIKGFATVLNKCFGSCGTVGRMGGDEFLAVVNDLGKEQIDGRLLTMEALLAAERKKDAKLPFSVSYGYVTSNDYPGLDAFQLYKIADKKMYEMKTRVKHTASRRYKHDNT